jgi:hypothetical protein
VHSASTAKRAVVIGLDLLVLLVIIVAVGFLELTGVRYCYTRRQANLRKAGP